MAASGVPCEALLAFGRCGARGCPYNHDRDMLEMVFPEAEGWKLVPRSAVDDRPCQQGPSSSSRYAPTGVAPAPLDEVAAMPPPPAMNVWPFGNVAVAASTPPVFVSPASLPCDNVLCFGECRDDKCPYNHDRAWLREHHPDAVGLQESPPLSSGSQPAPRYVAPIPPAPVAVETPTPTPFRPPVPVPPASEPCGNMLSFGECRDKDCPYNHDRARLRELHPYAVGLQGDPTPPAPPRASQPNSSVPTAHLSPPPSRQSGPSSSVKSAPGSKTIRDTRREASRLRRTVSGAEGSGSLNGRTVLVVMDHVSLMNLHDRKRLDDVAAATDILLHIPIRTVQNIDKTMKDRDYKKESQMASRVQGWIFANIEKPLAQRQIVFQTSTEVPIDDERACKDWIDYVLSYTRYVARREAERARSSASDADAFPFVRPVYLCADNDYVHNRAQPFVASGEFHLCRSHELLHV